MTARRIVALKFIIYFCRRIKHALQLKGTDQRRRAENLIKLSDFFRNFYKPIRSIHFLFAKLVAENRAELLLAKRLIGSRIQIRIRLLLHVRHDVIPIFGNLFLGKINFLDCAFFVCHSGFLLLIKCIKKAPVLCYLQRTGAISHEQYGMLPAVPPFLT